MSICPTCGLVARGDGNAAAGASRGTVFDATHTGLHERSDEAAQEYRTIFETRRIMAERISDRHLERLLDSCNGEDREILLRHVLWICCHIPVMINRPAGQSFCLRWIRCVEGILVANGLYRWST
jgi:hypothetical protein